MSMGKISITKNSSAGVCAAHERAQAPEPRNDGREGRAPTKDRFRDTFSFRTNRGAEDSPIGFSSRGYTKLSNIIKFLKYDLRGKTVLDIGSSTGGFTACALDNGAKQVVAIEKGTNQMAKPLRFDPRIDLREKTDIFDVKRSTLPHIDTVVADVSFISLKPVLTHAKKHLADKGTEFLVMLKPQFEAKPTQLNKGVIKNERFRREIIKDFELWLTTHGFIIKAKRDNLAPGKTGNLERFYYLTIAK